MGAALNGDNPRARILTFGSALILGCLLPLAFSPFHVWPLAILSPAALIWLLDREMPLRKRFLAGWLFGVGYFGFGVYWIYNSLHVFGQAPPVVAGGLTGLMVIALGFFAPGLVVLLWGLLRRHHARWSIWSLPPLWFALEWVKGWILTGMPWLSLGYSQTDSVLAGYAPIVGVYGISALLMVMATGLVLGLRDRNYPWLGLVIAIPLLGWLLQALDWTRPHDDPLDVVLVQGNIPQELKWRYDQRQNIFNTYWRETSQHWDADLIVWPETALPGRSEKIQASVLDPMQEMVLQQDTALITGVIVSDKARNHLYNSALMLGENPGVYHKRHLVMFGEYYPMRDLLKSFEHLIRIPFSDLQAGPDEQPLMRVGETSIGLSICFEDVFSRDIMRDLPEANLLINLSNDAWFGDSTAPHQHMQIAQMRALETRLPMLRATNTGVSAFVDFEGRITLQSEQFKTESIRTTVQGRIGKTPFYYFQKLQAWLALAIIGAILLLNRYWTRQRDFA